MASQDTMRKFTAEKLGIDMSKPVAGFVKNTAYDPNDSAVKRYIPSVQAGPEIIAPETKAPDIVAPAPTIAPTGAPEGIKAVFGDRPVPRAVKLPGGIDVFTIGEGGKWIESPEEFEKIFGTREQAGIVSEISPEQAKLLGVRPEGVAELKATRQRDTDKKELFDLAQQAGLSFEEAQSLVASQFPVDTGAIREELGISDVAESLFQMPDKTIQEIYQDSYTQSELPNLKTQIKDIDDKIAEREADLVKATGEINQNPWLSQGSRTGRLRILNELAFADISNLEKQRSSYLDLYDKGVDELEGVMLRGAEQYELQKEMKAEQLNYLLGESERIAGEREIESTREGLRYAPEFLKARIAKEEKEESFLTPEQKLKIKEAGYVMDESGKLVIEPVDITDASVDDIMDAIKQVESGGNYEARGASGEYGAYQFMPGTWAEWSRQYAEEVLQMSVQLEMTQENQDAVARWKIQKLVDQGYNPKQVASIWNSGQPEWEGKVGINKQGVRYDVPAYVSKVASAIGEVSGEITLLDLMQNKIKNLPKNQRENASDQVNALIARGNIDGAKKYIDGLGTPLGNTQITDLIQARLAKNNIARISELVENLGSVGPMIGRFRQANPYDTDVVELKNLITQTVPGLARGIFKEVGVLTDTDINRYTQTIANPNLTAEQARRATEQLMETINTSIQLQLDTLNKAGKAVGEFSDLLEEVSGVTGVSTDGLSDEEAYQEYLNIINQ